MPDSNALELELAAALTAVKKAIVLCRAVQAETLRGNGTHIKDDRSPVTVADFGAQAVVLEHLARAFPDDLVVAEESADALRGVDGGALCKQVLAAARLVDDRFDAARVLDAIDRGTHAGGAAKRFWTLDPIDGTKGFLRNDQYAVALALIEHGKPVLGILGCPALAIDAVAKGDGCILAARLGSGADLFTAEGMPVRPISVSGVSQASAAAFCESFESAHSRHDLSMNIAAKLGVTKAPVRIDSQCKYAAIARGDAEIYLRLPTKPQYREKIWDHAAGCLIVQEAGGKVSDIEGKRLDFSLGRQLEQNSGIVATNGPLHNLVLEALRQTR